MRMTKLSTKASGFASRLRTKPALLPALLTKRFSVGDDELALKSWLCSRVNLVGLEAEGILPRQSHATCYLLWLRHAKGVSVRSSVRLWRGEAIGGTDIGLTTG